MTPDHRPGGQGSPVRIRPSVPATGPTTAPTRQDSRNASVRLPLSACYPPAPFLVLDPLRPESDPLGRPGSYGPDDIVRNVLLT